MGRGSVRPHSRGVGVLQEAELIALAVGAQRLHDGQDPGRGERGRRVESWSQRESAEEAREGAGKEGGEAGGGRGHRRDVQFREARAGPREPRGRLAARVRSLQLSYQGCARLLAPWGYGQPLPNGSLPPQDDADFCHLSPGQLPTSPGLSAPLVSNLRGTAGSPEEEEEEYDRENRVVTRSAPHPRPPTWLPRCAAAGGGWTWRQCGGDGRNKEQQGDGKPSPPLPALNYRPSRALPTSFPRTGQPRRALPKGDQRLSLGHAGQGLCSCHPSWWPHG